MTEEFNAKFTLEEPPTFTAKFTLDKKDSHEALYNRELPNQHPISAITNLTETLAGKQDTIEDLDTIRAGAAEGATAVQPSDLATVATTGNYNDLSNKPTIPAAQVNSDWNANSGVAEILNKPNLATVATTGAYSDLTGTPTIPAAQVQSDWTQADSSKVDYIKNKPTIPTVDQTYNAESANAQSGVAVASAISGKQDSLPSQTGQSGKFLTTNGSSLSWASAGSGAKVFSNCVSITSTADSTYASAGYNYKVTLMCTGMTSSMTAMVIFSPSQADSGNYASICETTSNLVYIYAKETVSSIIVPMIIGWEVQ